MSAGSDFAGQVWSERYGPAQAAPDRMSYPHSHTNIRRQPEAHVMSTNHFATGAMLKLITIRLDHDAAQYDAEVRYELALNALAAALLAVDSSVSPAWTVQPAPGDDPLLYQLTPFQERSVSSAAAWEMTNALRRQVGIAAAEPMFTTLPEKR